MPYSKTSLEGRAQQVRRAWEDKPGAGYVDEVFEGYAIVVRDGKYFRVPYTLESDAVSFGDAEEVVVEYQTVTEACEALQPIGKKWELRVIREGVSKKGWIYTQKALESLLPFLNGAKLRAVKTASGVYAHEGTVLGEVGSLSNARGVIDDGFYEPRAQAEIRDDRREWLAKALESGEVNGVSINAPCEVARLSNGQVWVKKFTGFIGLDLATVPSAGGVFLRATESLEGETMNLEQIIALLKKHKRDDLVAKLGDKPTLEQAQEALEEALSAPKGTGPAPAAPEGGQSLTAQEAKDLRESLEQVKLDRCEAYLDRRLSEESKLPEPVKARIRKHFGGSVFAREALDNFISAEKETLDQLLQSGYVRGAGQSRVEVTREAIEKLQVGMDKMFGVVVKDNEDIPAFRGLLHAYKQIVGEDYAGRFVVRGRATAQEAIVSSDFPALLDRTMNRRLAQDYSEFDYEEGRIISSRGSTSDFKLQEVNRVGYYADPPIVDPEIEDYPESTKPSEESVTYRPAIRGELTKITEITMRNDDLDGVIKRIRGRGRAYRRGFARYIWGFYFDNAVYQGDEVAWFADAEHANLMSDALAPDKVVTAVTKLMAFTEPDSGEKIGLDKSAKRRLLLVVPDELWDAAKSLNERQYLDDDFTPNPVHHLFGAAGERIVVNPLQEDANDWGVIMDASDREIIEVKFLDGRQEPETWIADMPAVGEMLIRDTIVFKDRFVYGAALVDFRNAVKSVVANG